MFAQKLDTTTMVQSLDSEQWATLDTAKVGEEEDTL